MMYTNACDSCACHRANAMYASRMAGTYIDAHLCLSIMARLPYTSRYDAMKCGMLMAVPIQACTPALTSSRSVRPASSSGTITTSERPPTHSRSSVGESIDARPTAACGVVDGALARGRGALSWRRRDMRGSATAGGSQARHRGSGGARGTIHDGPPIGDRRPVMRT